MFGTIVEPVLHLSVSVVRPGLAVEPTPTGAVPSRIRWLGPGRVAPPFFLTRMEGGATELAALQGTFFSIIAVRFRHRSWISFGQYMERCRVAVREKLRWNRNLDDYFVN
jgi:hypothetical protein